jgi:hypothetical protein
MEKELNKETELTKGKLTLYQLFIYTLMPGGQLYARVIHFKGTLDMPWFLLPFFLMGPLQFIPLFLMYLGYFNEGSGGEVIDNFVWIPIYVKIIIEVLLYLSNIFELSILQEYNYIASEIIMIITIAITKYLHTVYSCKYNKQQQLYIPEINDIKKTVLLNRVIDDKNKVLPDTTNWYNYIPNKWNFFINNLFNTYNDLNDSYNENYLILTYTRITSFIIDAIYENSIASFVNIGFDFIPWIGWGVGLLRGLNLLFNSVMSVCLYSTIYTCMYVIQNMFEHSDMVSMCNLLSLPITSYIKLLFGLIISAILYFFNLVMSGAILDYIV